MARIIETPKDRIVMIEFSEDETDKLREIACYSCESINDTILGCFRLGILKCLAAIMKDNLKT